MNDNRCSSNYVVHVEAKGLKLGMCFIGHTWGSHEN